MTHLPRSHTLVFALGSNLGDPLAALCRAAAGLARVLDRPRVSGVYRTPPEGGHGQPDYLNAVLGGDARLSPEEALRLALGTEAAAGRERSTPGAARTLDVDVLFVGAHVVDRPHLKVPHPRWAARDFVVVPMLDILPQLVDPRTGASVADVAHAAGWRRDRFPLVAEAGALLSMEAS